MTTLQSFDPADIDRELEQRHRDAMLDLILAWGALDGALGMLVARVSGIPFVEGAKLVEGMSGSARLAEVRRVLLGVPGGEEVARIIKNHKKNYERYSVPRNRIAHARCVGVWKRDRDFIVFAVYKKVGDDALAVDAIPIQELARATRWGNAMTELALRLVDRSG